MIKAALIIFSFWFVTTVSAAEGLQPYIMMGDSGQSVEQTAQSLESALGAAGFEVLGQYAPAELNERRILTISHPDLLNALSKLKSTAGFLAAFRVGVISMNDQTLISTQNLEYWGNAYLQDEYSKAESVISNVSQKLKSTIEKQFPDADSAISSFTAELRQAMLNQGYGSTQGFDQDDLREYHYMLGMPYFEDNVLLGEFDSHEQALSTIEKNLKNSDICTKVFEQNVPGKESKLFGIALKGESGEGHFMPIIDIAEHKHVTFLPYEILVMGNEVRMLHGRFRIALSFPDLTMGTFTNIMSTPGDIEDQMSTLTKK